MVSWLVYSLVGLLLPLVGSLVCSLVGSLVRSLRRTHSHYFFSFFFCLSLIPFFVQPVASLWTNHGENCCNGIDESMIVMDTMTMLVDQTCWVAAITVVIVPERWPPILTMISALPKDNRLMSKS